MNSEGLEEAREEIFVHFSKLLFQALCCYSVSKAEYGVQSLWAQTAAHHSGKLPFLFSGF